KCWDYRREPLHPARSSHLVQLAKHWWRPFVFQSYNTAPGTSQVAGLQNYRPPCPGHQNIWVVKIR
uniref:Uncharacterized protein n=1 Tax=Macaca fascicularis TaxID=9541 RepID=A0A7N9DCL3_MACFA